MAADYVPKQALGKEVKVLTITVFYQRLRVLNQMTKWTWPGLACVYSGHNQTRLGLVCHIPNNESGTSDVWFCYMWILICDKALIGCAWSES